MKRFAVMTCSLLISFEVSACSCSGDGAAVDGSTPDTINIPPPDGSTVCNPVSQTGCAAGEKCTWIQDTEDLGHTGCVTDGSIGANQTCTSPTTGADDCVKGYCCLNDVCIEICNSAPNSCPTNFVCSSYDSLLDDIDNVGLCNPVCDPVQQDCSNESEACYLQAVTGESSCAGIPGPAAELDQGDPCYGPSAGECFLNGCAKGYGANLPDGICAFFCNPVDNWAGNTPGLVGDPNGIDCNENFGGARINGPGPSYECRYIQTFYSNTDLVPATTGMCLLPADFEGSCSIFDYDGLTTDVTNGVTIDAAYCEAAPEKCMFDCISLATLDAIGQSAPSPAQVKSFMRAHLKKLWDERLDSRNQ